MAMQMKRSLSTVKARIGQVGVAVGAVLASGAAMAQTTTTVDAVLAAVTDFQTNGVKIAGGLTLAIFLVAAAKWLRKAK